MTSRSWRHIGLANMRYILFLIVLFSPTVSFAAELRFDQSPTTVRAGDTFIVDVTLQTGGDTINAVEGSVHFSSELSLSDVRLRGSVVPLWVAPPEKKEAGVVNFAGVLPGGYSGKGNLFTLVFSANQKGTARISFGGNTAIYQNDGQGTAATLALPALAFPIDASIGTPNVVNIEKDVLPPEPFTPTVSAGEPFGLTGLVLVFTTQDKNSGISRYDISRSYHGTAKESDLSWSAAQSPYKFVAGDSAQYLYVRAVDRAGNTRVAVVRPQEFSPIAFVFDWWPFLLLITIGVVILGTQSRRFLR